MKSIILFSILSVTVFDAFSAELTQLKQQCNNIVKFATNAKIENKSNLESARSFAERIKSNKPPLTEFDLKRCIWLAYEAAPSLRDTHRQKGTYNSDYDSEPTDTSSDTPLFRYPFPAFASSEIRPSWRTYLLGVAKAKCEEVKENLRSKKTEQTKRQAMEEIEQQANSINYYIDVKGDDIITAIQEKIFLYAKCFSMSVDQKNGKVVFNGNVLKEYLNQQYRQSRAREERFKIKDSPCLSVTEMVFNNAMSSDAELTKEQVTDIVMALDMFNDMEWAKVYAQAVSNLPQLNIPSELSSGISRKRKSKESEISNRSFAEQNRATVGAIGDRLNGCQKIGYYLYQQAFQGSDETIKREQLVEAELIAESSKTYEKQCTTFIRENRDIFTQ